MGATGFCMGGALALAAAPLLPEEISAAAPFYGIPRSDLCDVGKIKAPVQAHFGSKDTLEGSLHRKMLRPLQRSLMPQE